MQTMIPMRRRHRQSAPIPFPFAMNPFMEIEMKRPQMSMRTDVTETEDAYQFVVELPGFSKEEVSAELVDGYLTISAQTSSSSEDTASCSCGCTDPSEGEAGSQAEASSEAPAESKSATGDEAADGVQSKEDEPRQNWLRRERFFGSCQRSYYVGDEIDEESISAHFENGLLSVTVPKMAEKQEQKKQIAIS